MHSDNSATPYIARFSDGKTAGSADARARLTERGVEIDLSGRHEPLVWPYGALSSAEPLNKHSIDALLTYSYQPGATLFVSNPEFARKLAVAAPQLSTSAQRWRVMRPLMWAVALVFAVSAVMWVMNVSVARGIAGLLPDEARRALGKTAMESFTNSRRVCSSPKGTVALKRLTEKLSKASGTNKSFDVIVVDWDLLNAFATPGEQIVLTRGLIQKAGGPDEIAGVLGHEMGHGIELHPEAGIVRAIGLSAAIELMMGGSAGTIGNLGLMLAQLSYSRDAEREADLQALRLLKAAEISPKGLSEFFDRVARLDGERGGKSKTGDAKGDGPATDPDGSSSLSRILRSHPLTEERRKLIEAQAPYQSSPALGAEDWQALQDICKTDAPKKSGEQEI
jgi:beta-barrel assembly-enhancing protease